IASGNFSEAGIGTSASLRLLAGRIDAALACGTATIPVTSLAAATGAGLGCAAAGAISEAGGIPVVGAGAVSDCRPIGVGDVSEGSVTAGGAGLLSLSLGSAVSGEASLEISFTVGGDDPPSSSIIAILKETSKMTATL